MQQANDFEPGTNQGIWQVVRAIPAGSVCTYGEVARLAGLPGAARRVGAALKGLPPDTALPWHRVINARGRISLPQESPAHALQRQRLEAEGVQFKQNGAVDLRRYCWRGGS